MSGVQSHIAWRDLRTLKSLIGESFDFVTYDEPIVDDSFVTTRGGTSLHTTNSHLILRSGETLGEADNDSVSVFGWIERFTPLRSDGPTNQPADEFATPGRQAALALRYQRIMNIYILRERLGGDEAAKVDTLDAGVLFELETGVLWIQKKQRGERGMKITFRHSVSEVRDANPNARLVRLSVALRRSLIPALFTSFTAPELEGGTDLPEAFRRFFRGGFRHRKFANHLSLKDVEKLNGLIGQIWQAVGTSVFYGRPQVYQQDMFRIFTNDATVELYTDVSDVRLDYDEFEELTKLTVDVVPGKETISTGKKYLRDFTGQRILNVLVVRDTFNSYMFGLRKWVYELDRAIVFQLEDGCVTVSFEDATYYSTLEVIFTPSYKPDIVNDLSTYWLNLATIGFAFKSHRTLISTAHLLTTTVK